MKIITWNVNGLRAVLKKPAWGELIHLSADTLCFQEIKVKEDQLNTSENLQFTGYKGTWHSAERAGYSGVLTLSKQSPDEIVIGCEDENFDVEGRVLQTRFNDIWLINVYVPQGKRNHERVPYKLEFYDKLLKLCNSLVNECFGVIICGDINTAHQAIDLKNAKQNENTSGFLQSERDWITSFIAEGFVDVYRIMFPNEVKYTWWSYQSKARERNVGWRLDYFLISNNILARVRNVKILDEILGSDHCPVQLEIES